MYVCTLCLCDVAPREQKTRVQIPSGYKVFRENIAILFYVNDVIYVHCLCVYQRNKGIYLKNYLHTLSWHRNFISYRFRNRRHPVRRVDVTRDVHVTSCPCALWPRFLTLLEGGGVESFFLFLRGIFRYFLTFSMMATWSMKWDRLRLEFMGREIESCKGIGW
jgi:hypothetical protein